MAKDNIYWCDDCGTLARDLSELFDGAPRDVSWCPGCGRLEDENGTVTPRDSKKTSGKIALAAVNGLNTDGAHHKQYYLEHVLELAVGESEFYELYSDHGWREATAP